MIGVASPIKVDEHYPLGRLIANSQVCIPKDSMRPPFGVQIIHKRFYLKSLVNVFFRPRLEMGV